MLNLKFLSEKGILPQFAAAKLHLICQTTKLLAVFLLKNVHFETFGYILSPVKEQKDYIPIGFVASASHSKSSPSKNGESWA